MPTTGVSGLLPAFPDALELLQEAADRAGVDMTSGYALESAFRSLKLLTVEWSNKGFSPFSVDTINVPLVAGQEKYSLPLDTLDVVYPVLRVNENGKLFDTPLGRIDVGDYSSIPNKAIAGRPSQIFVHRVASPEIFVYPVPDARMIAASASLVLNRLRIQNDVGMVTNQPDIPLRLIPAMVAGLAFKLSEKSKDPFVYAKISMLKAAYEEALTEALQEDRDRSTYKLVPRLCR